jgi:methionyl-tRNA synthetase
VTRTAAKAALDAYDRFEFSRALEQVWSIVSGVDKFIVERAPWKLAKDAAAQEKLDETLYTAAEALRLVTALAHPVLPHTTAAIWNQMGFARPLDEVRTADLEFGLLQGGQKVGKIAGVFPRLDVKSTVEKMQNLEEAEKSRQAALMGTAPAATDAAIAPIAPQISIDDFAKVDLRVGEVKSAEPVKGADKLLHLKVDIGEAEPRTIVAGIALAYKPESLIGRKVVIVANLEPRKLRGLTSQGMIVAASVEGDPPVLAGFHEDIKPGARLK